MRDEPPVDVLKMSFRAGADEANRVHLRSFGFALERQLASVGDRNVGKLDDAPALLGCGTDSPLVAGRWRFIDDEPSWKQPNLDARRVGVMAFLVVHWWVTQARKGGAQFRAELLPQDCDQAI